MPARNAEKLAIVFLRAAVVAVGAAALAFLLLEPRFEGRNAHAALFETYFADPFLMYVYAASAPFFAALARTFALLGFVGRGETFSEKSADALRAIKRCALAVVAFALPPLGYLLAVRPGDDIAGGRFMGMLVIFLSLVAAAAAHVGESAVRSVSGARAR